MPRQLKTYLTSIGFFDLAIAARSMKAALEAWGADSNLFHQGFARETDDRGIVAAALAHPGVVLRRPVGSKGAFKEHADLPEDIAPARSPHPRTKKTGKSSGPSASKSGTTKSRSIAAAFDKQQRKREAARRKEELAEAKQRERAAAKMAKAQRAFEAAEHKHDENTAAIEAERDALEQRARSEDQRWEKQRAELQDALRRVRSGD